MKTHSKQFFKLLTLSIALALATTTNAVVATGSGFAISKRNVLTAYHVVDKATTIKVEFPDGSATIATIEKKSVMLDWALLRLEKDAPAITECSIDPIKLGDKIYTLGYPTASILGKSVKYAEGTVSALSGLGSDTNSFQYSVPIQPGNSGGPIFNDKGLIVGIVQATINPEMYFSRTGGALPQAINFGLQIRSIISELTPPAKDNTSRTIGQNQQSTCFITAEVPDGVGRSVSRKVAPTPPVATPNAPAAPSINYTPSKPSRAKRFEDGVVSDRYKQLADYLANIAKGKFVSIEGDALDVMSQDGYDRALESVVQAKSALKIETLRMIFMHTTDLPQNTIDSHTDVLAAEAHDSIRVFRARKQTDKGNFGNLEFFGLKLGSKIDFPSLYSPLIGRSVIIDGMKNYEYTTYTDDDKVQRQYLEREDWPARIYLCFRTSTVEKENGIPAKLNFLDSNIFYLICSESGTLVGIAWRRKFPTTKARDLVKFLERKYSINFDKTLPEKFSVGDAPARFGFRDKAFAFISAKVEIYVMCGWRGWDSEVEELHILLPGFEKILQEDRLKAESTRQTDQPNSIDGADTL